MSGADEDKGFLDRWSRRKRTIDASDVEPEAAPLTDAESEPVPEHLSEEELAALPRVEDLVESSDIRGFLRPGVPKPLKNAALRRMWMLTPAIRDHADPAVDYAWDWNTPGGVPGDGIGPAPERAVQMLRDLFAPQQPEPAVKPDPAPVPQDRAPGEKTVPTDELPPRAAGAQVSELDPAPETDTPPEVAARRHGGALPV